jgi:hypothetical protein
MEGDTLLQDKAAEQARREAELAGQQFEQVIDKSQGFIKTAAQKIQSGASTTWEASGNFLNKPITRKHIAAAGTLGLAGYGLSKRFMHK